MLKRRVKVLFLASVLALASFGADAVETIGDRSCGKWIEVRKATTWNTLEVQAWLIGYLSGLAVASNKDIAKGTDNESIHAWMDNYCKSNPLKYLGSGGLELYRVLVREKNL